MKQLKNLINLINNHNHFGTSSVGVPSTNLNSAVMNVLRKEGIISTFYTVSGTMYVHPKRNAFKRIECIYNAGVSVSFKELSKIAHHNELYVISTNRGVLSIKDALKYQLGGVMLIKCI